MNVTLMAPTLVAVWRGAQCCAAGRATTDAAALWHNLWKPKPKRQKLRWDRWTALLPHQFDANHQQPPAPSPWFRSMLHHAQLHARSPRHLLLTAPDAAAAPAVSLYPFAFLYSFVLLCCLCFRTQHRHAQTLVPAHRIVFESTQ